MGPLAGIRVVEMAGIGPAPFCGMLLADLGADVLRVDRLAAATDLGVAVEPRFDVPNRGKRAVAVDLKAAEGVALVKDLVAAADILIEGFRPGVMERLGLGPDVCLAVNPRLVFGRMTGWGQSGPLKDAVGHDINYIALTGALAAIGPPEDPAVPLNLVGDFGGGALYLAMGVLAALLSARASGQGQVVDAAMVDGAASLLAMHHGWLQAGIWSAQRGSNLIDGGAPFYTTYRTADGRHVAVGAVERRFFRALLDGLGLAAEALPDQHDRAGWPVLRARIAAVLATRTRDDWTAHFAGSDACVSPVLDLVESVGHPHLAARGTYVEDGAGVVAPAPAPRFARTPGAVRHPARDPRDDTAAALAAWGVDAARIATLAAAGVIAAG